MLDFATKHFLVISSFLIVISAALSMIFLGAYLSVFDLNLIWLIEYSDLTKLMMVGVALLSSTLTTFIYLAQDAYAWLVKGSKQWKWVFIVSAATVFAFQIFFIAYDIWTNNGQTLYLIYRTSTLIFVILLLFLIFRDHTKLRSADVWAVSNLFISLTLMLGSAGAAYGHYVKDVSKETRLIETQAGPFNNAKLIMFLSHHIAFVADKQVVVLATSEVKKIISKVE